MLARLHAEGAQLYTCDVVTCEILSHGDESQLRHLRILLNALEYVATSPTAARCAAELGATVITRNRPDFERQGIAVLTY